MSPASRPLHAPRTTKDPIDFETWRKLRELSPQSRVHAIRVIHELHALERAAATPRGDEEG